MARPPCPGTTKAGNPCRSRHMREDSDGIWRCTAHSIDLDPPAQRARDAEKKRQRLAARDRDLGKSRPGANAPPPYAHLEDPGESEPDEVTQAIEAAFDRLRSGANDIRTTAGQAQEVRDVNMCVAAGVLSDKRGAVLISGIRRMQQAPPSTDSTPVRVQFKVVRTRAEVARYDMERMDAEAQ